MVDPSKLGLMTFGIAGNDGTSEVVARVTFSDSGINQDSVSGRKSGWFWGTTNGYTGTGIVVEER